MSLSVERGFLVKKKLISVSISFLIGIPRDMDRSFPVNFMQAHQNLAQTYRAPQRQFNYCLYPMIKYISKINLMVSYLTFFSNNSHTSSVPPGY
jgi:hypothetical protein